MVELPGPQDPEPPRGRTRHPYFMHDMIRRQAVAVRATHRAISERLATDPVPPPDGPLVFVGLGTSFHAALGARWGAAQRHRWATEAVSAWDVLDQGLEMPEHATAVVFSASGETSLTNQALAALRERRVRTVLVTAAQAGAARALADVALTTEYSDEASWTHTVSFTTALTAAGLLLDSWSGRSAEARSEDAAAELITASLASENAVIELVDPFAPCNRWLLVGSGAGEVAAREGALKLREAAGRFCAAVGTEELLHGVLPSVTDRSVVIALATSSLERTRALEGLGAARILGARTLLIDASGGGAGEGCITVPSAVGPLQCALEVIPLQLLAYWTAAAEGRNPDVMGLDDPRVLSARKSFGI